MTKLPCNNFEEGKDEVMLEIRPKRPRNAAWFKDKAMLAEAQKSSQILDGEQLAFLTVSRDFIKVMVIQYTRALSGSESRPPILNKENYVPWSSRLLWYAKSRQNGKLIHNSILNGPHVRKMIPEPGDANRDITVTETFHLQTNDKLSDKELKQIEADDQAIQIILL
nr:hypothetical protein [Tanacetum cinerariifolium]